MLCSSNFAGSSALPAISFCFGSCVAAEVSSPKSPWSSGWLNTQSSARPTSPSHSRRAFRACGADIPMSPNCAIFSASSALPVPEAPRLRGSSISGSSIWAKSQFIAASESEFPVACSAFSHRTRGKPMLSSELRAASFGTNALLAGPEAPPTGASSGSSSSFCCRPADMYELISNTASST